MLRKAVILNSMRLRTKQVMESEGLGEKLERMIWERVEVEEKEKAKEEMGVLGMRSWYGRSDYGARALMLEKISSVPPTPMSSPHQATEASTKLEEKLLSLKSLLSRNTGDEEGSGNAEYQSPNDAYASISTPKSPKSRKISRDHAPEHPSPLGLSNYDAFDLDDEYPDPYAHFDEHEDETTPSFVGLKDGNAAASTKATALFDTPTCRNTTMRYITSPSESPYPNDQVSRLRRRPCINGISDIEEAKWPSVVHPSTFLHLMSPATANASLSPSSAPLPNQGRPSFRETPELPT